MQRTLWNRFLFNQASILNVNIRHICKHTPILFKDKQLEDNFPITSESSSKLDEARKLLPKRYKAFEDHDTEIIYDDTIDLDMILNQKQKKQKPKFQRNQEMGLRGKRGVFDIEELVELLREERFREIVTIAIPKELRYGDFMVICTGTSIKHIKNFVETFNQIYKLKKSPNDPFLNLDDRSKDWRLIDLGNINLHIFLSEAREFYDIETLWSVGREFDDKTQRIEKSVHFILWFLVVITIVGGQSTRPNFLILIADDLGIGDISIFGNDSLSTPNIDRIGQEGVVLSHHITAASVCTPSRSAFLTGRYPIRSGMASSGKSRVFLFVASTGGLPSNETTFAQSLKAANYTTALFGKWHLGSDKNNHHPNVHGFDYFYGIPLTNLKDFGNDGQSVILSYFPHFYLVLISTAIVGVSIGYAIGLIQFRANKIISIFLIVMFMFIPSSLIMFQRNIKTLNALLYRNQELIEQPIELNGFTDRIIYESNKFIRQSHKSGQPFLAVVNFLKVHTAHFPSDKFSGKSKFGKYGDCVLELDNAVGQILKVLQELNIENNTFVYFSSDNGAHLEEVNLKGEPEGGSNGIFRGGKGHGAMEGGIRVPSLAMWPSVIPPNRWINVPTMQMDIFPTIHAITEQQLPVNVHIDGKNILPLLQGQMETSPHEFMFHYCGSYLHGIRWIENDKNIWKVYYYTPKYKDGEDKCKFMCMCFQPYIVRHDPPLVYNIGQDPSERNAIDSNSEQYHRVVKMALEAKGKHERNIIPVPSQLTLRNTIWRPWLQPYNI